MIPENQWKWFGFSGHFIGANCCRFRMCTQVGRYLVSTVGAMNLPSLPSYSDYSTMYDEVGPDRLYETMVFKAGAPCQNPECDCGMPDQNGQELLVRGYQTAGEATRGHYEICREFAEQQ